MPQPDSIVRKKAEPLVVIELGITHFHALATNLAHLGDAPADIGGAEAAVARYHHDLGEAGHEYMLMAEVMLDALKLERIEQQRRRRDRRWWMVVSAIALFAFGLLVGTTYGIEEGRVRARHEQSMGGFIAMPGKPAP